MTKAVRVHKVGGPEALVYEDVDVPAPGPGEVRIRQHAVGVNFIDVYFRTGLYKAPGLPFIAGNEAAGEVVAVGPGVTNFHPGDRVAYYFTLGGYASERVIPADKLVKLPDHITYEQGAVLMLKGLTVWYLLHKTFKVEPGHRVLIHAAAGGIGLLACQWAKALGAHVIGTVGSKAKADLALSNGCDHVILYNEEDFVARVKQISRNELCDVVYDGVGKTTFPGSLSCLRPRGLFVSFGNASGPVPPFPLAELNNHGSLFATRPKLNDYVSTRKELLEGADTLFAAVINGKLHVPINHAYALKDAAKAHTELESRATTGAAICGRRGAIVTSTLPDEFAQQGGGPARTRTSNLRIRNAALYPIELRNHAIIGYDPAAVVFSRHCLRQTRSVCARERSDDAIHPSAWDSVDCFASLAMTVEATPPVSPRLP